MPIEQIDLTRGRKGKDFGQGFYLSADHHQAAEMAETTVRREGFGTPVVTSFLFDYTMINNPSLNIRIFSEYSSDWVTFVVANRTNKTDTPIHDYDIVYGPIADDRVGPQIRRYQNGWLDARQLMVELRNVRPTFQYFFGTQRAIDLLTLKQ